MLIHKKSDVIPSEITSKESFENRRNLIKAAGASLLTASGIFTGLVSSTANAASGRQKINSYAKSKYGAEEKLTPYDDVTNYNNYYEFGTSKTDPSIESRLFKPSPWAVSIEGAVKKNKQIGIEDIFKLAPLEERIYRMRCVEGWSMVIPWIGFPLAKLIQWAEPTANAKYVEFISLSNDLMMAGQRIHVLDWPYVEGLRMDEAMNPLTLLTFGLYGEVLPKQNGAPVRIVVPWKYGFKSAKSIVKIRFTEEMPKTSWSQFDAREYGFYSNVNPQVDHPRWSQASERRIGDSKGAFAPKIKTQMFNGYGDQVASMYAGMDLKKFY